MGFSGVVRAVTYRLRGALVAQWRATVWLGVIVAIAGGTVLLIASGAQRTSSAPDRYTAARGGPLDAVVTQEQGRPRTAEVAALPSASSVRAMTFVFGGLIEVGGSGPPDFGSPDSEPPGSGPPDSEPLEVLTLAGSIVASGEVVVAGREPDPEREGEFVATRSFVEANDVELGDRFRLVTLTQEQADRSGFDAPDPAGPTLEAVLVGVVNGPNEIDFPTPSAVFSPSLLAHPELGIAVTIMATELRPGVDLARFRAELDTLPGSDGFSLEPGDLVSGSIRAVVEQHEPGVVGARSRVRVGGRGGDRPGGHPARSALLRRAGSTVVDRVQPSPGDRRVSRTRSRAHRGRPPRRRRSGCARLRRLPHGLRAPAGARPRPSARAGGARRRHLRAARGPAAVDPDGARGGTSHVSVPNRLTGGGGDRVPQRQRARLDRGPLRVHPPAARSWCASSSRRRGGAHGRRRRRRGDVRDELGPARDGACPVGGQLRPCVRQRRSGAPRRRPRHPRGRSRRRRPDRVHDGPGSRRRRDAAAGRDGAGQGRQRPGGPLWSAPGG